MSLEQTAPVAASLTRERQVGANLQARYFPALDGLRAVAVITVFFHHYARFQAGWMGVDVFFVLSGFLITGILYDTRDRPKRFRNFYVRRSLRIFPLYFFVWIAIVALTPLLHIAWQAPNILWPLYLGNWIIPFFHHRMQTDPNIIQIACYPFRNSGAIAIYVDHFWSLCMEEQFYLLWPLLVFTLRDRITLLRLCIAVAVISPVLRILLTHFGSTEFVQSSGVGSITFIRLDEFLIGGLGALLLRGPYAQRLLAAAPWLFWCGLAVLFGAATLGHYALHPAIDVFVSRAWVNDLDMTMADLMALGAILLCVTPGTWLARFLNVSPLRALGRISYGFYVFHDLPHLFYDHFERQWGLSVHGLNWVLPLLCTLLLSLASYFLLERPFLRLKTRFEG